MIIFQYDLYVLNFRLWHINGIGLSCVPTEKFHKKIAAYSCLFYSVPTKLRTLLYIVFKGFDTDINQK